MIAGKKISLFIFSLVLISAFVVLFDQPAFSQTRDFQSITAVEFKDGTTIRGKIIEMNADIIRIQKLDGNVETRKFNDAARFIKEGGSPQEVTQQQMPQQYYSKTGGYLGLFGGYVIPSETDFEIQGISFDVDLNDTWLLGAKFGFIPQTAKFIALEIEYNHIFQHDIDKQTLISGGGSSLEISGDASANNLLFNLIFRYPEGQFHPYAGGGVGWCWFDVSRQFTGRSGNSTFTSNLNESGDAFAWQLIAGVNIDITPMWSLDLGYKYFNTEPDIAGSDVKYSSHIFTAGFSVHF